MAEAPLEPTGTGAEVDPSNLTDEQQMLLRLRDTLYEGSWDDFARDLRARRDARPHVFDIVPASETLRETIAAHLRQIDRLRNWERRHGTALRADGRSGSSPAR